MSMCVCSCLSATISSELHVPIFTEILCMLPKAVAGAPLAALRYVMYFRFYE